MKRPITLIIFIFSTIFAGWSQSRFYHVDSLDSQKSIVREFDSKRAIAYNENSTSRGFCLLDFSTMTATYAELPGRVVVVNDLEIIEDRAYFCGTYSGIPYVGHFKIDELFAGTGDYHLHHLNILDNYHSIENPEKLDLYNAYGEEHVVLVGGALHYDLSRTNVTPERFVMDVHHDNPSQIDGRAVFNESTPDFFYDISATDNFVVTIDNSSHTDTALDSMQLRSKDGKEVSVGDWQKVSGSCVTFSPIVTTYNIIKDCK